MTDRPDPTKIIDPETGRPLSEARVSVWDTRVFDENNLDVGPDAVTREQTSNHQPGSRGAVVEVTENRSIDEIVDEMMELLFGE